MDWVALVSLAVAITRHVGRGRGSGRGEQRAAVRRPPPPWNDPPHQTVPAEPINVEPNPVRVPTQASVTNTAELVKALKDNVPKVTLAAGVYDLTAEPGVVLSGKAVELDATDGGALVKVLAAPRGDKPTDPRPGSLTFHKCESVKLKGVRFEVSHADGLKGVGLLSRMWPPWTSRSAGSSCRRRRQTVPSWRSHAPPV